MGETVESPQLVRFSYLYNKNPHSRVFAPLANSYRKLGMYQEAFDVLKKGLKDHPDYTLGYIVLAKCHNDLGEFHRAYEVIKMAAVVEPDNFSYKKLRTELAYRLDSIEDAYNGYLQLREIDPTRDYSARIAELENKLRLQTQPREFANYYHKITTDETRQDDWVQMNFSQTQDASVQADESLENREPCEPSSLVSLTLLKLYMKQENYPQALKLANSLLEQDSDNQEVKNLRDEIIQSRLFQKEVDRFEEEDDELSEDHLDQQKEQSALNSQSLENSKMVSLQQRLQKFQEKINLKSAQVQLS